MRYSHPGPTQLTLFTMKNVESGNGGHSALMISASERVIWDPAGTFHHPDIPERNDVIIGVTPQIADYYIDYHSRETFYTVAQTIDVPPAVAEQALRLAYAQGAAMQATCTLTTSKILSQLPGFESIRTTYFPNNLSDRFARLPGVRETVYRQDDSDDNAGVLYRINVRPLR